MSYHDTVKDCTDPVYWGDGPFSRHGWFELLEKAGHLPFLAMVRDDEDTLLLPLEREDDTLAPLTNWYVFTWSPIGEIRLIAPLVQDLVGRADRFAFRKLPEEDGVTKLLAEAFADAGWFTDLRRDDVNHILPLAGRNYDEYLASRPGPLRSTIKRKAARLDVTVCDRFNAEDWAAYEVIYSASWKPHEGDPALLRAFAIMESDAGRYRFAIARHEGRPVAAQFWTVDGGTAYIHKLAHRRDADSLSPGTVLTAALMKQVIDLDAVEMVDFGTGDDAYKRDWMEQTRTRWSLTCVNPRAPRNWPRIAKARAAKLVYGTRDG
ncbi:hypothetical protein AAW01_03130 [Aurantiacibacter gangjinensis]|uniref:BioF2-like acetyltransferase domain-containing protein n=1 Tax=Aurantiacibacter gangjinensis TaxID=502682 RepID=A0A0G9MWM0_9SPHN|nr:hypothetical protein AAW01_03130 [Aurantiacibacter gangjinensis]